jgi:hypothetical protein
VSELRCDGISGEIVKFVMLAMYVLEEEGSESERDSEKNGE